jgi:phosphoribosylaminoimidazole carboxylase PurE protein
MGSKSDLEAMAAATAVLDRFEVGHETEVASAHRQPALVTAYAAAAAGRGIEVIIAGAGLAAHLPGVVAAHTTLPVIGVPLAGATLGGVDALYSCVQMPPGVPVATVAIGGAANAAVLAVQILALGDDSLRARLYEFKRDLAEGLRL